MHIEQTNEQLGPLTSELTLEECEKVSGGAIFALTLLVTGIAAANLAVEIHEARTAPVYGGKARESGNKAKRTRTWNRSGRRR